MQGSNLPFFFFTKRAIGSCGGYVRTYKCVSGFMNASICDDICWDVDNLFELNDRHDLDIRDFILPKSSQSLSKKKKKFSFS